ncbi:hypothetical protein FACS1894110_23430 [Spirochaetia bacterium]|nr:hypothetical protein FACS1894110_23430 [Spirochaetia bacterium]
MINKTIRNGILMISLSSIIMATGVSCSSKKDTKNNIYSEISNNIIINDEVIKPEPDNIFEIFEENIIEDELNNFIIPKTYEEALELMNELNIENVVLERITINDETYTVVEAKESGLTVGTDTETMIYDIPDKSGNILFTLPYKKQIRVTVIAIIEEPSLKDWGGGTDHWVKIRIEDGTVGWVRGEYTSMDRGGIKYQTAKNIWLEKNYVSHWR